MASVESSTTTAPCNNMNACCGSSTTRSPRPSITPVRSRSLLGLPFSSKRMSATSPIRVPSGCITGAPTRSTASSAVSVYFAALIAVFAMIPDLVSRQRKLHVIAFVRKHLARDGDGNAANA
jgi:hypothetical protein